MAERSRLPATFWVIWLGTLVNRLGTMVQPFMAFYLTATRGLSVGQAGAVMGLFGLGSLLSPLAVGPLVDRWDRRAVLALGLLLGAAVMLEIGYTTSLSALLVGMLLFGFVVDAYRPASSALVADIVPAALRPRAFGMLLWAVNLGFTAGALSGGLLIRHHHLLIFWIDAVTCVLFGALVWFAVPAVKRGPARSLEAGSGATGFRAVARDRLLVAFCFSTFGYSVVYLQSVSTLPLRMNAQGFTPSAYGYVIAVNSIVLILVQPFTAGWITRLNPSLACTAGMVLSGVGFGATALATSRLGYIVTVVVWTIGEILFSTVSLTIVFSLAPAHLRGRYAGAYGFAWSLATLVAPIAGSQLLLLAAAAPWLTCALVSAAAATVQITLTTRIPAQTFTVTGS